MTMNYQKLHEWASSVSPVFIVGPERSGTSMMFQAITAHEDFCGFKNATVETFCYIKPFNLTLPPCAENYEMRLYLGNYYNEFKNFIDPISKVNEICNEIGIPKKIFVNTRSMVWNRRHYRELIRAFFYFSWLNLGEKRLAEKTPAHIRCVNEIIDCFPNAKILVCLRNPIEIIASHRKRYLKELQLGKSPENPSLEWLNKSVDHYLGYFQYIDNAVKKILELYPRQIMLIPYEKVTKNNYFLNQIYDFVGINSSKIVENKKIHDRSLLWDPLLSSLPTENNIIIHEWLSADDISKIKLFLRQNNLQHWCV